MRPFAAIYSTFLQRGYDQVVHDVAIQRLPVRFAIDRAGLVGADGATHAGAFDVAFLSNLPGFVVMAAADEAELVHMVATAAAHRRPARSPSATRAARASAWRCPSARRRWRSARGRIVREGGRVALLSFGTRLAEVPEGRRRRSAQQGPCADGRRCPLRQAAGPRADPGPGARPRGADHHRGRGDRRLRQPCRAASGRGRACSTAG